MPDGTDKQTDGCDAQCGLLWEGRVITTSCQHQQQQQLTHRLPNCEHRLDAVLLSADLKILFGIKSCTSSLRCRAKGKRTEVPRYRGIDSFQPVSTKRLYAVFALEN